LLDSVEEAFNDIAGPVELWAETGPSPASLRVHGLAELAGADHTPYVGDSGALLDGIEEFLTGIRPVPSRIELWQQFFSPMSSILRSRQHRKWGDRLQQHHVLVRRELARFRGREANAAGDRFLIAFDGPGRAHPLWDEHLAAGTLVGHRHRVETLFP
jgi:hypothetical protein